MSERTESPVVVYADRARDQLLKRDKERARQLVQAYAAAYNRLKPFIEALEARWVAESEKGELTVAQMRDLQAYKDLLAQIRREIARFGEYVGQEMSLGAIEAIEQGMHDAQREIELSLGRVPEDMIREVWRALPSEAIETLLGMTEPGSPMRDAMDNEVGPAIAERVSERLLEDVALGVNPRRAAARTTKELGTALNWTLRTYRTAQIWSYRVSKHRAWAQNPDLVSGWVWHARLNQETCPACIAKHGTRHKATEILNDHYNGACTPVPIPPTYQELLGLEEPIPGDVPPALTMRSGIDWFNDQPAEMQRAILGGPRYRAFANGAIKLEDLVRTHDDPVLGEIVVEGSLKGALGAQDASRYYETSTPGG